VRLLPGVGPQTQASLDELNIRIIRDLVQMKLEHLTFALGRLGLMLFQRALGIDNTPVYPERAVPAMAQDKVLAEDSNDYALLKNTLFELCERACEQLRAEKQRAGRLELRIRYSDYRESGGKEQLTPPLQSAATLYAHSEPLLNRILTRRTRVRSLHLRLTDLTRGFVQLELFGDPKPAQQAKLESALDVLRKRYGTGVLKRAS
jgi:DNA polymerase-4